MYRIAAAVMLSALTAATVAANLAVVFTFFAKRNIRRVRSNFYILSLAFTDLMVGAVAMPLSVDAFLRKDDNGGGFPHGKEVCLFWLLADTAACTASVWNLVAIAADRLVAVAFPITYLSLSKATTLLAVAASWAIAAAITAPAFLVQKVHFEHCRLVSQQWYTVYAPVGAFAAPILLIAVCYSVVLFQLLKRMRKRIRRRMDAERRLTSATASFQATGASTMRVRPCVTLY